MPDSPSYVRRPIGSRLSRGFRCLPLATSSFLGGLIDGVWLTLIVGAPGFGALSGVLVKLDGGALVLVGAGPFGGLGGE